MKTYRAEYCFADDFLSVDEWKTTDALNEIEAYSEEEATLVALNSVGPKGALFRITEIVKGDSGEWEPKKPEYYHLIGPDDFRALCETRRK